VTQLLEMNLEMILRFIGSVAAFSERLRSVGGDVSSLTASVQRQSIEFGERQVARLRQLRPDRRRLLVGLLLALACALRFRALGAERRRRPRGAGPGPLQLTLGAAGAQAAAASAESTAEQLDSVWRMLR
jgi:hypothetical protein